MSASLPKSNSDALSHFNCLSAQFAFLHLLVCGFWFSRASYLAPAGCQVRPMRHGVALCLVMLGQPSGITNAFDDDRVVRSPTGFILMHTLNFEDPLCPDNAPVGY
jgi:hypothetical protein